MGLRTITWKRASGKANTQESTQENPDQAMDDQGGWDLKNGWELNSWDINALKGGNKGQWSKGNKGQWKKGAGKGFQGECWECGEWGHSASNCPKGKGKGKGSNGGNRWTGNSWSQGKNYGAGKGQYNQYGQ